MDGAWGMWRTHRLLAIAPPKGWTVSESLMFCMVAFACEGGAGWVASMQDHTVHDY